MERFWLPVLLAALLTLSGCGGASAPGTDSAQSVSAAPDSTQSAAPDTDLSQSVSAAPDSAQSAAPVTDSAQSSLSGPDTDLSQSVSAAPEQTPVPRSSEGLTDADARRIALERAGLSESDVAFIRTNKELDDGRMEYEIEFSSGAIKYDYTIDAETGAILSFESDDAKEGVTFSYDAADAPASVIGQDAAKAAALTHAGLSESDVSAVQIELDRDDGRVIYEVTFFAGRTEYDYEIDAVSGEILSAETDND